MDVFRFTNPDEPTKMFGGVLINGLTSKTWIERYRDAGEFTFEAPIRTGIRENLPIGSFVSHIDSKEIMIVEDHVISGKQGDEITVQVTGHSFETYLDQRVVGPQFFPVTEFRDYIQPKQLPWHQLVNLIRAFIDKDYIADPNDELPWVLVSQTVPETEMAEIIDRTLARGSLYEHVLKILGDYNLGIRSIRPPDKFGGMNTTINIHKGVDRTGELIFRYDTGEIDSIEYLFSNQKLKNSAVVSGKWVEIRINGSESKYDRRVMHVSATDIDQDHETPPEGKALELVEIALWYRGMKALQAQNDINLKKAEIAKGSERFKYRKDYDLGDLVGIGGGYLSGENEPTSMRITEHVEIEDENGRTSYPTLSFDPPPEQTLEA